MANVKNDWLGYLDRSFSQIKTSLLTRVVSSNPELTDHSESNPFVIIIEMFAAIAEMLGYYIDNVAEESFLATANRRSSIIKHTQILDYRVKARWPETVDITIAWNAPVGSGFTIDAGMSINSTTGLTFYSLTDVAVALGASFSVVPVAQIQTIDQPNFATTNGQKNQRLSLGTAYVHKSLELSIDGNNYEEVTSFARSTITSRHFIVEIDEDGNAYVVLGNGIKGILETSGLTIAVTYKTTDGADGKVGAGQFDGTSIAFVNALPGGVAVSTANSLFASSGGSDYEDNESIRNNAIQSIRTLNRAVTRQDHIDVLEELPGVGKAAVHFCCGKTIDLYIVPTGGGVASSLLISEAQAEIDEKKMVATFPEVNPAGETALVIIASVTARKRKSISDTKTQVESALVTFGLVENQEINGAVRLSDLQALIDNLSNVDFVDITGLYTKPYARPIDHPRALNWTNQTNSVASAVVTWRLDFDGTNFRIFRDGVYKGDIPIGNTYLAEDNSFTFVINAGAYIAGDRWEFTTYPYLKNIQLVDYTIFRIFQADLQITILSAPTTSIVTC